VSSAMIEASISWPWLEERSDLSAENRRYMLVTAASSLDSPQRHRM
jgi:hypothetical protein